MEPAGSSSTPCQPSRILRNTPASRAPHGVRPGGESKSQKPEEARLTLEGGAGRNWLCVLGHVVTRHSLTYHHRPLLLAARAAGRAASTSTSAAATQRGSGTQRPMACPARPPWCSRAAVAAARDGGAGRGGGGGGEREFPVWVYSPGGGQWAAGSGQPGSGSQLVG